jgi:hypothetical protein
VGGRTILRSHIVEIWLVGRDTRLGVVLQTDNGEWGMFGEIMAGVGESVIPTWGMGYGVFLVTWVENKLALGSREFVVDTNTDELLESLERGILEAVGEEAVSMEKCRISK